MRPPPGLSQRGGQHITGAPQPGAPCGTSHRTAHQTYHAPDARADFDEIVTIALRNTLLLDRLEATGVLDAGVGRDSMSIPDARAK